jgi:peptidoglycan/LPS O-acetylase OafA/YrhL
VGYGSIIPGGFGVTVFFFLSGFLITTLLRMELAATGKVSLRDFYLRRVLRILPPFYTVLAFATLLVVFGINSGPLQLKPMLALLFHFSNYWNVLHGADGQPPGTAVYWSLAVEEHFYFVFPALFLLLQIWFAKRPRAQAVVLVFGCLAVLAWRLVLVLALHSPTDRTYLASDTRVDSILFGCALALGANPTLDEPGPASKTFRFLLVPLGFAVLLATFLYRADWFRETLRYSLQGLALTPIFIAAMRSPSWWPFHWLNHRLLRRVGVLSYSLYLTHHAILYAFERNAPSLPVPLQGALALLVSLGLAEAIHRFIEKPCAKLRKRLGHTPSAPITQPAAA